jgi:orotidine-5'-phosphate decarboxylase
MVIITKISNNNQGAQHGKTIKVASDIIVENRIILALDHMTPFEAMELADKVSGEPGLWGVKIGVILANEGIRLVRTIKETGLNVMCDPKIFEIDSIVEEYLSMFVENGANIVTLHCSNDYNPPLKLRPFTAGVTVLTTFNDERCEKIYNGLTVEQTVRNLGLNVAQEYNYGHLVCSAQDLKVLFDVRIPKICPAIRPLWYQNENDDQVRKTTPGEAMRFGADFVVIGRPILEAKDPLVALEKTYLEMYEERQQLQKFADV